MKKAVKQYMDLVADLTELKDWEFKEAIKIAKQFRKAQARLGKATDRQEREMLPTTTKENLNKTNMAGVEYAV